MENLILVLIFADELYIQKSSLTVQYRNISLCSYSLFESFCASVLQFYSYIYIHIITDLCHLSDKCLPYMVIIMHYGGSLSFCSVACDFHQYQNPRPASIFNPCLIPIYNYPLGYLFSSNVIITVTKT